MSPLLDAALGYAARGWPVFPCTPDAKTPAGHLVHRGVLDATTDPGQIRSWWTALPDANVAIATGAPGPDVIDVDVKNGSGYDAYAAITTAGLATSTSFVQTPSGGLHAYYQGTAQRNGTIRKRSLDFRGAGGYVLAPPSAVNGTPYTARGILDPGSPADWAAIRALLDPPPDPAPFTQPHRDSTLPAEGRPGDDWATRTTWAGILTPHGWRKVRDLGNGRACWCRPGKTGPWTSATTREQGGLYVFSTSTEFDPEVPYSKFGALALLEHGGDHAAAARRLRADGYGAPLPAPVPAPQLAAAAPPAPGPGDDPARTSWRPLDLAAILDGDTSGDPPPVLLHRADGRALIYAGKVNALIGESESGKTWIALAAAAQAMAAGLLVAYLDFEDAPAGITGRLSALGATRAQLEKLFRYIAPDEPLTPLAGIDLAAVLAERPALAVVDGVNAAMSLLGLNLKDNKDVTDFSQRLLRPLKRSGAAVLTVDHVTKNKDDRGSYAIGAQAKRADIDGVSFIVEAIKKFGRGGTGELRLTVSKDRPGHVRAISAGAEYAGTARLVSHDDGSITVSINSPDLRPASEKPPWRPTGFMQRISEYLETCGDAVSMRAIEAVITGKSQHIRKAAERLIAEGYVTTESGPRNATMHLSARPYREASDPETATASHRVPTASPKDGTRSSEWPDDRVPEDGYMPSAYPDRDAVVLTVPEDTQVQPTASPCQACGEYHDGPCFGAAS